MSKAIMRSLPSQQCARIANGEQTSIISKTKPKLETAHKEYIYCTKAHTIADRLWVLNEKERKENFGLSVVVANLNFTSDISLGNGKVIGEYIISEIEDFSKWEYDYPALLRHINAMAGFPSDYQYFDKCLGGKVHGCALHISDLVIYDKPKELEEFIIIRNCKEKDCEKCKRRRGQYICDKRLIHPPQSWQYVEEVPNDTNP